VLSQGIAGSVLLKPAPGSPDPKQIVLKSSDLGGAAVSSQGYYKDKDFPSLISYERDFKAGRAGGTRFLGLEADVEIGTAPRTTAAFLSSFRRYLDSPQGRATLKQEFKKAFAGDLGLVSDLRIGRITRLGVGDDSFDLPMTFEVLGLKTRVHIAAFREERVLFTLFVGGQLDGPLPRTVVVRLARLEVGRARVQLTPRNTVLPAVSGTPQVGQTLNASTGTWTGTPTSFTYQWQRCDGTGANCVDIPGATAQTYVLTQDDVGSTIRAVVTARNAVGTASASSAATSVVPAVGAPTNTSPPTITGTAQQGQTLTASTGSWTGNPTSFAFQWQHCDASGNGCAAIAGATGGTYVVGTGDVGYTLRVTVTATNSVGSASAVSAPTSVVV
jgi:hypothetical protein